MLAAAGADEKAEAVTAGAEALALALGSAAEVAGAACDAAGADDATGAALALAADGDADGDAEADESEEPEPGEEEPEFWELLLEEVSQETVQDFFSSTRGSPLGPVTGVSVIVQVSVTGPAFLSGVPRGRRECQQGRLGREGEGEGSGRDARLAGLALGERDGLGEVLAPQDDGGLCAGRGCWGWGSRGGGEEQEEAQGREEHGCLRLRACVGRGEEDKLKEWGACSWSDADWGVCGGETKRKRKGREQNRNGRRRRTEGWERSLQGKARQGKADGRSEQWRP